MKNKVFTIMIIAALVLTVCSGCSNKEAKSTLQQAVESQVEAYISTAPAGNAEDKLNAVYTGPKLAMVEIYAPDTDGHLFKITEGLEDRTPELIFAALKQYQAVPEEAEFVSFSTEDRTPETSAEENITETLPAGPAPEGAKPAGASESNVIGTIELKGVDSLTKAQTVALVNTYLYGMDVDKLTIVLDGKEFETEYGYTSKYEEVK